MKLNVEFNADLMKRYVNRGASPVFTIYWAQDQLAYPEDHWLDFGSVILGWWLVAAKSLLEGAAEAELPFMDGPYRIKAHRVGNVVHFSADEETWVWRMQIDVFAAELLRAADKVQQELAALGISDNDSLRIGAHFLRLAMSQAKPKVSSTPIVTAELVS